MTAPGSITHAHESSRPAPRSRRVPAAQPPESVSAPDRAILRTAERTGSDMPVEKLFPDSLPIVVEGVPPVVVATGRRTFYFTGQIATDSNGELVGDTIEEQALQVFRNLEAVAAAVGVTLLMSPFFAPTL